MAWKECKVCGEGFEGDKRFKTCSDECSKENRRVNRIEEKRRYRAKQVGVDLDKCFCVICGSSHNRGRVAKTCSNECSKKLSLFAKNREKIRYNKTINGTKNSVRGSMKRELGFEPPADLVEDATALRLLNRALRNHKA